MISEKKENWDSHQRRNNRQPSTTSRKSTPHQRHTFHPPCRHLPERQGFLKRIYRLKKHRKEMQPHASELEEAIIGACLIEQEVPCHCSRQATSRNVLRRSSSADLRRLDSHVSGKQKDRYSHRQRRAHPSRSARKDRRPYTIVQLSSRVASSAHIEYHAQIVHQKYLAREAVVGFNKLLTCAMDETIDIDDTPHRRAQPARPSRRRIRTPRPHTLHGHP